MNAKIELPGKNYTHLIKKGRVKGKFKWKLKKKIFFNIAKTLEIHQNTILQCTYIWTFQINNVQFLSEKEDVKSRDILHQISE